MLSYIQQIVAKLKRIRRSATLIHIFNAKTRFNTEKRIFMPKGIKQLLIFNALLCIVLLQVAFVSGGTVNGNVKISNATVSNATISNSTVSHATISNSTVSNATVNIIKPQKSSPDILLQTGYIFDTLEAGKTYIYKVQVKNLDKNTITIEPKINSTNSGQAFGNDAIVISAPKTIKASEIANMTITVTVPENAAGIYSNLIGMNVNGAKNNFYNPRLLLSYTVKKLPAESYVETFSTTTAEPITIEVSADSYNTNMGIRISPKIEDPSFQLGLTCDGNPVDLVRVKTVKSGIISVGNSYPYWTTAPNDNYLRYGGKHCVETYKASGAVGEYEVSILPKHTYNFGYSITIGNNT